MVAKGLNLKKDLQQNILTVVSGTIIAQLIPIAIQPILRRIYTPEDFGVLSVYTSILSILTVILTLRYSHAINIPKNEILAKNLLALSFILSSLISFTFFLTIALKFNYIASLIGVTEKQSKFLYVVPFGAYVFSVYEIINFWLIRKKEFKKSVQNKISRRISEGILNIYFGHIGIHLGLIIGDIFGSIVNVFSGFRQLKRINFTLKNISLRKVNFAAVRFSEMPKYNLLPQLLNTLCLFLPVLFINKFYSSETAGYFNLTLLVLNIPIVLIGNSISEVLIQRFSELRSENLSIKDELKKIVKILTIFSFLMILLILLFGKSAFSIVFGKQWYISGVYAKIFVWAAAVRLVSAPLNIIFIIFEKVRLFAIWQILYFAFTFGLVFMGFLEFKFFLILLTTINVIFYTIVFFMSRKVIIEYEFYLSNKAL